MSLHVEVTGTGPDLVLLHGWAMHGGVFDGLLPTLAAHYRVHCIDLPGHGRSAPQAADTLADWAEAIAPYIPERALLLGWSLGGLLALQLAQQTKLRAMVLISSTPRFVADASWPQGMAVTVFAQFFSKLQQNVAATVQDFLRLQVRGDAEAEATMAALQHSLLQYPADATSLQQGLRILRDTDIRTALPDMTTPTLVLAGEYDRIAHPQASAYLAAHLPHAQYQVIKRAGHAAFLSHRQAVLSLMQAFFAAPMIHLHE